MEHRKLQTELLSPAGNLEILRAVAVAGADAVYAAGDKFGARAYASNLTEEQLLWALDWLHLHGKRFYLTVNTLLKPQELEQELYQYLEPLYRHGLDGVIVQDLGVLRFLRENFPGMELHASTQMCITGVHSARLLQELGACRVVPARELSLAELTQIKDQVGIEMECFVHGALCYCYSGRCLLSSILGGRSGNRGRCAQPCRLPYIPQGGSECYPLSPKDLSALELLPQLIKAGVFSMKIEGRMKQLEYAAGVTEIYRYYLDLYQSQGEAGYQVHPRDQQRLLALGNRSGFTQGYYQCAGGPKMMAMEVSAHTKKADVVPEEKHPTSQDAGYQQPNKSFGLELPPNLVTGTVVLSPDKPAELLLEYQGRRIQTTGAEVQTAKSRPLTSDTVREKLEKTGGSEFAFQHLDVQITEDCFLPVSELNQLRRQGIELLRESLLKNIHRVVPGEKNTISREPESTFKKSDTPELAVSVHTTEQLIQVLEYPLVARVELESNALTRDEKGLDTLRSLAKKTQQAGKCFYLALPMVMRKKDCSWYQQHLKDYQEAGVQGFVARDLEGLSLVKSLQRECVLSEDPVPVLADSSLYAWSKEAYWQLMEAGADQIVLPIEANQKELIHRGYSGGELLLYGYLPLMVSAQCLVRNTGTCKKQPGIQTLTDRYGKTFYMEQICGSCYNVLYNTQPMSLLHLQDKVSRLNADAYRISFIWEDQQEMETILDYYQRAFVQKQPLDQRQYLTDYTNGHFKRGVE